MEQLGSALPLRILDILPNPVLVKDQNLKYVWINQAFENLFAVSRDTLIGRLDKEMFPDRQVAQCNGGDLRVLETGDVDQAVETVFDEQGQARETITRKSRLILDNGETFLVGVMHDITDVTRANEALEANKGRLEEQAIELARLATTDVLTGCSNRRVLDECARMLFDVPHLNSALLMLDIDFFKPLNDKYGHECGDEVLRHFADIVRSHLENADYFVRLGGEEFCVCLTRSDAELVNQLAEDICRTVAQSPFLYKGHSVSITVSIGTALKGAGQVCSIDEILSRADDSLYAAKSAGRNQVVKAA